MGIGAIYEQLGKMLRLSEEFTAHYRAVMHEFGVTRLVLASALQDERLRPYHAELRQVFESINTALAAYDQGTLP